MKIKLLKKIRKRFSWYWNKDNFPVLIDHKTKSVDVLDLEYLKKYNSYTDEEVKTNVQCTIEEWAQRHLFNYITKPYGYSYKNLRYNIATRRSKIKNRSKI